MSERMSERARNIAGYVVGFLLFAVMVPSIMWLVSAQMRQVQPSFARTVICVVLAAVGLSLSVWSLVYMRTVGKGNPMDAFNHDLATRTSVLMTQGPYALCRNPMVLGVVIYYLGVMILLGSVGAVVVFALYAAIMTVQIRLEEKRLEDDFGEEYLAYKQSTKRLIPFVW